MDSLVRAIAASDLPAITAFLDTYVNPSEDLMASILIFSLDKCFDFRWMTSSGNPSPIVHILNYFDTSEDDHFKIPPLLRLFYYSTVPMIQLKWLVRQFPLVTPEEMFLLLVEHEKTSVSTYVASRMKEAYDFYTWTESKLETWLATTREEYTDNYHMEGYFKELLKDRKGWAAIPEGVIEVDPWDPPKDISIPVPDDLESLLDALMKVYAAKGLGKVYSDEEAKRIKEVLKSGNEDDISRHVAFIQKILRDEVLEHDVELFRYYGPCNRIPDMVEGESFPCFHHGGCRMRTCVHFMVDEEDEEMDDWFTGNCYVCDSKIEYRTHAVRIPVPDGGWTGCFCSWHCVKVGSGGVNPETGEVYPASIPQVTLIEVFEKMYEETGVYAPPSQVVEDEEPKKEEVEPGVEEDEEVPEVQGVPTRDIRDEEVSVRNTPGRGILRDAPEEVHTRTTPGRRDTLEDEETSSEESSEEEVIPTTESPRVRGAPRGPPRLSKTPSASPPVSPSIADSPSCECFRASHTKRSVSWSDCPASKPELPTEPSPTPSPRARMVSLSPPDATSPRVISKKAVMDSRRSIK